MERQIKFRAKRLDNGKWAYGGLIEADDYCIIDQGNELYVERDYVFRGDTHFFQLSGVMCDEKTIGQFTGFLDKNGKEIYEGDIVRYIECDGTIYDTEVRYADAGFTPLVEIAWMADIEGTECKVIGNIHDNPDCPCREKDNHVKLD